jgi:hypothetical protein
MIDVFFGDPTMAVHDGAPGKSNSAGTPIPNPVEKSPPETDDQARRDGGKTAEGETVSKEQIELIKEKAVDHTKDEPGS